MYLNDWSEERLCASDAVIVSGSGDGELLCSACARISTRNGSALEILQKSTESSNNTALVSKVLASGHKSLIEHFVFNIAFNNVSVLAEQFIIEFRLASYTVQSRRYVDFRGAGYHVPSGLSEPLRDGFVKCMDAQFAAYEQIVELGVPKEDARFVLPYCFKSNFFCTVNARELMHMICSMLYGRGSGYPELSALGESLKSQFDSFFPGALESERPRYSASHALGSTSGDFEAPSRAELQVELLHTPSNSGSVLREAMDFVRTASIDELVEDSRPRELELLHYCFKISDLSLAAITHLARHRIQTLLVPEISSALARAQHILPATVAENSKALAIYNSAFERASAAARNLFASGMPTWCAPYFALAGHTLDVVCDMNARELLHFLSLRCCNRAQWEIRDAAISLLKVLRGSYPELFAHFGPSCYLSGSCPEGRMTCGKISEVKAFFDAL